MELYDFEFKLPWQPTHVSAVDGSPARVVGVVVHNEDGYTWLDRLDQWVPIERETVTIPREEYEILCARPLGEAES